MREIKLSDLKSKTAAELLAFAEEHEVENALLELRGRRPGLKRAVVKLNDSFSGEGNALFRYPEEGRPSLLGELACWQPGDAWTWQPRHGALAEGSWDQVWHALAEPP